MLSGPTSLPLPTCSAPSSRLEEFASYPFLEKLGGSSCSGSMSIGTGEIGEERNSATSSASSSAAPGPHRDTNDDGRSAVAAMAVLTEAGRCSSQGNSS